MTKCIVLLDVDDPEYTLIASDDLDDNLVLYSYEEADNWCRRHAIYRWVRVINLDDDDDD